jgi:tetratricopeptide (TPR) repeat protein
MLDSRPTPEGGAIVAERYKLLKELKGGNYGKVWRAQDLKQPERAPVVLKFPSSNQQITALKGEVEVLRELSHPNLITLYYSEVESTFGPFYVMDFAYGKTLESSGVRLKPWEIVKVIHQTYSALAYIHSRSVIHLDIKPDNLICDPDEVTVRLIDFGLARTLRGKQLTVKLKPGFAYSPGYIAPEIAKAAYQGRGLEVGTSVDIFALGVVLYEWVTGESFIPTEIEDEDEQLEWLAESYTTPIELMVAGIAPELTGLIGEMLSSDPAQRPTAAQLLEKLARVPIVQEADERSFEDLPLWGRQTEEEYLRQRLSACKNATGSPFLTIAGPAGVGKTRLMARLQELAAQEAGFLVLETKVTTRDVPPYAPLARLVQQCLDRVVDFPEKKILLKLLPELTDSQRVPKHSTAAEDQSRLVKALLALFRHLTVGHSVLLSLDEAQESQESLLELLGKLRSQLEQQPSPIPLLFCLNFRTGENQEELPTNLQKFFEGRKVDLSPQPLNTVEVENLLHQIGFERDGIGRLQELAEGLTRYTQGRPLFLREKLRQLAKENALIRNKDGGWRIKRDFVLPNLEVKLGQPATRVMSERIQSLSAEEQKVAVLAALLGFDFELDLLAHIAELVGGISKAELEIHQQHLRRFGILRRNQTSGRYQFTHDLLYQAALKEGADNFRLAVGKVVETYYGLALQDRSTAHFYPAEQIPFGLNRPDNEVEEASITLLADCFQVRDGRRRCCGYMLLSAEKALNLNAYGPAEKRYKTVLEQLELALKEGRRSDEDDEIAFAKDKTWLTLTRFHALRGLAQAYHNAGLYALTDKTSQEAIQLAEQAQEIITSKLQAFVYLKWVETLRFLGRYQDLINLGNQPFVQQIESPEIFQVRILFCHALQRMGYVEKARELAIQLLQQVQNTDYKLGEGRANNLLCIIETYMGYYKSALVSIKKSLEIFERLEDDLNIFRARANMGIVYGNLGQFEEMRHCYELNLQTVEKTTTKDNSQLAQAHSCMGEYYYCVGKYGEAEKHYEIAHQVALDVGDFESYDAAHLINLGALYTEYDIHKAEKYLQRATKICEEGENKVNLPELYRHYAHYFEKINSSEKAKEYYLKAIEQSNRCQNLAELGRAYQALAELLFEEYPFKEALAYLYRSWQVWCKLDNRSELKQVSQSFQELYSRLTTRVTGKVKNKFLHRVQCWDKRIKKLTGEE